MLIYNDIKKQITYSKHQEVVGNWGGFFPIARTILWGTFGARYSPDVGALKCSHVMLLLWLVIMLTGQPYYFHLSLQAHPWLLPSVLQLCFGVVFFPFLFTFFNLSVEIAHWIVTPLIEKYNVKTDNAVFVEGLACTSIDLSPILQTAGSYLRCKATLIL